MNHEENRKNRWLTIVIVIFTVIITIVDFNTPRGVVTGILYVVPVFLSLWLAQRRITFIIGTVSVLLAIIDPLVSPPSPLPLIFVLVNRGISVLTIALLVIVGTYSRAADYFSLVLQKRTVEQALVEAEERYRSLVRLGGETGEAIVMMQDMGEREGVHIFCNKVWPQLTSYSEEELLKMSFFDLVHTENRQECLEVYRRKMREGNGAKLYEMSIVGKHGNVVQVELTCGRTNYRWRPANVVYIRDITERKKIEEETRKLSEAVEATADIIFITDNQGVFQYVNSAFEAATGYKKEEVIGKTPRILKSGKQDYNYYKGLWETILAGGVVRAEVVNQKKNGELFHVEQTVTPIKNRAGNISHFVSTNKDITERKYAEKTLRKSEQKYRELVTRINDGIFTVDTQGVITFANRALAEIHGFDSPEEIIGKTFLEFIAPAMKNEIADDIRESIKTGNPPKTREMSIIRKDGGIAFVQVKPVLVIESSTVVGLSGVVRDVTEQKQIQGKLIITDKLASVGQLAAGIMHEINNPLSSVVGFAELLMSRKDLPADAKDDLNIINSEAQRIVQIVKGLLTFARQQKPEKEPVDIHIIIQRVLQLRAHEHKVNNIAVDIRFAPDLPRAMGNVGQLQQVFLNLIANAEQAMFAAHKRGTLTISTERLGDVVKVCFADDGPGIRPENMGKLFTPFFTTKEAGKGTGLGLSICHGIVTEHGGNIYAESEPGKGATFIVELPISK